MDNPVLNLGKRKIGPGNLCFIVAELSGNHNQDINRAYEIIDAAADAGVDAVKLQTYTPDTLTINCDNKYFRIEGTTAWAGQTLYDLYKAAYTPWEWQPKLKEYGEKKGLIVFSTPFDNTAVDFLEKMNVLLYKVASFEAADIELLERVGQTLKPIILSRGLATLQEIQQALTTLKQNGASEVAVLHCVSSYPALPEEMNLAHIEDIHKRFNVIAGLSDHSLGIAAAKYAVGKMHASIIEKHLTLDRNDGGPDAEFSLEPDEMKELVEEIRDMEKNGFTPTKEEQELIKKMKGSATYQPQEKEKENIIFRRSLFVVKPIKKGELLTRENIRSIRPGYGLAPSELKHVLGKKARVDIEYGTPLSREIIIDI